MDSHSLQDNISVQALSVDGASKSIDALRRHVDHFCLSVSDVQQIKAHAVISLMHETCMRVEKSLAIGCSRVLILQVISPIRDVLAGSPFIRRIQEWPRSIPGDYETVEYLIAGQSRCDKEDSHFWIEWYALNTAIAQQHRNKVAWQRSEIKRVVSRHGRILSLGCGGFPEADQKPEMARDLDFVLVDIDAEALRLAQARLAQARSVVIIHGDAVRGLLKARQLGPFDLILCGGLFDYLTDTVITRLLRGFSQLWPNSHIAFTNIDAGNPYRVWMEFLASWFLIHRSKSEVVELCTKAAIAPWRVQVQSDMTGLALLCKIEPAA